MRQEYDVFLSQTKLNQTAVSHLSQFTNHSSHCMYCALCGSLRTFKIDYFCFTSESPNPSVAVSFAVDLDLRSFSMCLSPSSSDKHTKLLPCTAILTSSFCLFGILPTIHRSSSRQVARCETHHEFHTCS